MISLLNYDYKIYMKCNKFMMPLMVYLLFQLLYYSTGNEKFVPSVIVCASLVFVIMTWMGFSFCELQDWRTEQIVFLKINNGSLYWISKIVFMFIIGAMVSLIGVIWPLVISYLKSGTFLNDEINVSNIALGFFILILSSFMGILLGMVFQTRVVGNRNKSILILLLIIIISIVKIPITNQCPITKIIIWILPPINNLTNSCININRFSLSMLSIPIFYSMLYIFLAIMFYIRLMKKILF